MKTEFAQPVTTARSTNVTFCLRGALIVIAYILLYGHLIPGLVNDWSFSTYSYGYLVPVAAGYLVWLKRSRLKRLRVSPSLWGNATLLLAVLLLLVGQIIGDSFVMRVSMVLALAALIHAFLGARFLKELRFPIFYLALMIPVPYVLVNTIVNYLMVLDAKSAATILQLLGTPVYLDSNFLHLPNITLEVAYACSGIRSIFALFVLGTVYSYIMPLPLRLKVLLAASTVPLAVITNLIRIVVTVGLTYYVGPIVLDSLFHKFYGVFNFLLAIGLLIVLGEVLRKKFAPGPVLPEESNRLPAAVYGAESFAMIGWNSTLLSILVIVMAIWLSGVFSNPPNASSSMNLRDVPWSLRSFTVGAEPWADAYQDTNAEQAVTRHFVTAPGIPVELFVGYRGKTGHGERLQSPKLILPPNWSYVWVKPDRLEGSGSEQIEGNWMLTQKNGARRLVLYWYQYDGGTFSGEIYYRLALFKERFLNHPGGMFLVRIATPVREYEKIDSAQDRLKNLAFVVHNDLARAIGEWK